MSERNLIQSVPRGNPARDEREQADESGPQRDEAARGVQRPGAWRDEWHGGERTRTSDAAGVPRATRGDAEAYRSEHRGYSQVQRFTQPDSHRGEEPSQPRGSTGYGSGGTEVGYGGYGPHGGGYGSQQSYASHPYSAQQYGYASDAPQPARNVRRGPKGYKRSDERMREDICEHLMHSTHIDSSDVTVEVSGGEVLLQGTVPDRRMKHAIEDMAGACPGVDDVDNRIRVARADAPPSGAWGSATRSPQEDAREREQDRARDAGGEARNTDTESRGPGGAEALSGRSTSSSSTTKPARD